MLPIHTKHRLLKLQVWRLERNEMKVFACSKDRDQRKYVPLSHKCFMTCNDVIIGLIRLLLATSLNLFYMLYISRIKKKANAKKRGHI